VNWLRAVSLTTPTLVTGGDISVAFVCLTVSCMITQKPLQLGSPNLTQKCSSMSSKNPFILVKRSRLQGKKQCWRAPDSSYIAWTNRHIRNRFCMYTVFVFLHSCECWLLLATLLLPLQLLMTFHIPCSTGCQSREPYSCQNH